MQLMSDYWMAAEMMTLSAALQQRCAQGHHLSVWSSGAAPYTEQQAKIMLHDELPALVEDHLAQPGQVLKQASCHKSAQQWA